MQDSCRLPFPRNKGAGAVEHAYLKLGGSAPPGAIADLANELERHKHLPETLRTAAAARLIGCTVQGLCLYCERIEGLCKGRDELGRRLIDRDMAAAVKWSLSFLGYEGRAA